MRYGPLVRKGTLAALVVALVAVGGGVGKASAATSFTVAGSGDSGYAKDSGAVGDGGPATAAPIGVQGIALLPDGGFLVTDSDSGTVRRVLPSGLIKTVVSHHEGVFQVAALPHGFLFTDDDLVMRVDAGGRVSTVAGGGSSTADGVSARRASLGMIWGLATLPNGGFLVSLPARGQVREITPDGRIVTVAGTGRYGSSGDGGPAQRARLSLPAGLAVLPDGGFLVADRNAERVRRVSADGRIHTVAGSGALGSSGDGGPATRATLAGPLGVAVTPNGGFVIASDNVVRAVDGAGVISTVAGPGTAGGRSSLTGDGLLATETSFNTAQGLAVLPDGGILVALTAPRQVRLIAAEGTHRLGAALRSFSPLTSNARSFTAHVALSTSAMVRIDVRRYGRLVSRSSEMVPAGSDSIALPGRIVAGPLHLTLTARTLDGQVATSQADLTLRQPPGARAPRPTRPCEQPGVHCHGGAKGDLIVGPACPGPARSGGEACLALFHGVLEIRSVPDRTLIEVAKTNGRFRVRLPRGSYVLVARAFDSREHHFRVRAHGFTYLNVLLDTGFR